MKIEIWSDVMCPFCYIGKKHFEQALTQIPYQDKIEVEWKSYQLNPDLSKTEITSVDEYLIQAKGISQEQVSAMHNQLAEMGKPVGIDFQQQNSKVVNTGDAHRLIHFAQANGKGSEAEERLFKAYFTEGKNVADYEVLAELAEEIGLNKLVITTDDGSYKEKGFAIDFMKKDIEEHRVDMIFACGPLPMLRAVREYAIKENIPCQISLEEKMACGLGVCLGCAVKTAKSPKEAPEYWHVCKAGPVFQAKDVEIY